MQSSSALVAATPGFSLAAGHNRVAVCINLCSPPGPWLEVHGFRRRRTPGGRVPQVDAPRRTSLQWAALGALLSSGCWEIGEQVRHRQVWEMQDHDRDVREAREALRRGDLATARQAGVWLAEPDLVPGLPEGTQAHLDAVRASARILAEATELQAASIALTEMTAHCAACHRQLAVPVPAPREGDGPELLWLGLVFESDERSVSIPERAASAALTSTPRASTCSSDVPGTDRRSR
jgi:hypothetical protein